MKNMLDKTLQFAREMSQGYLGTVEEDRIIIRKKNHYQGTKKKRKRHPNGKKWAHP